MSSLAFYPSLDENGWISSSNRVSDKILSDFFLSDFSQTYLYLGEVSSLPYIVESEMKNITLMCSKIQNQLTEYFSKYFKNILCECTEIENKKATSSAIISIYLNFTDSEENKFNIGKIFEVRDSDIVKVMDLNDNQPPY